MAFTRRRLLTGAWRSLSPDALITPPAISPLSSLYTDIASLPRELRNSYPALRAEHWGLSITASRSIPLMLSYADLLAMPSTEIECTLVSIGQRVGSSGIGNARWRGVALRWLLDELQPDPTLRYARVVADDGRDVGLTKSQLERGLLAYEVNGAPLPTALGFPVRLIVPGLYDFKMPGWVKSIEMLEHPVAGFWERRGWSASGEIQTTSAIFPASIDICLSSPAQLRGYAFAGLHRVDAVELSIDHGPWVSISFTPGNPGSWSLWQYTTWHPHAPGRYSVRVRATDETGFTQDEHAVDSPFPNGSSAVHQMSITVA